MDKNTENKLRLRRDRAADHGMERGPLEDYEEHPILLVERGWGSTDSEVCTQHTSVAAARRYHGQEYNWDQWRLVKIVDLDTGVVHVPAPNQPMRLVVNTDV